MVIPKPRRLVTTQTTQPANTKSPDHELAVAIRLVTAVWRLPEEDDAEREASGCAGRLSYCK
jgi:hypothetical protein